jgi:hypothetical protein
MRFRHLAIVVLSFVLLALGTNGARATEKNTHDDQQSADQYFVDFHARRGALLGHNFIVYGRLNAQGQALGVEYAGNHPVDGAIGLIVGSVVPVRTKIGPVKDDFADGTTIVYRRKLTAAQFARLRATVRHIRATEHYWHLVFFNCNDFVVEVIRSLGLRSPSPWLLPHAFVAELRALNSR